MIIEKVHVSSSSSVGAISL